MVYLCCSFFRFQKILLLYDVEAKFTNRGVDGTSTEYRQTISTEADLTVVDPSSVNDQHDPTTESSEAPSNHCTESVSVARSTTVSVADPEKENGSGDDSYGFDQAISDVSATGMRLKVFI